VKSEQNATNVSSDSKSWAWNQPTSQSSSTQGTILLHSNGSATNGPVTTEDQSAGTHFPEYYTVNQQGQLIKHTNPAPATTGAEGVETTPNGCPSWRRSSYARRVPWRTRRKRTNDWRVNSTRCFIFSQSTGSNNNNNSNNSRVRRVGLAQEDGIPLQARLVDTRVCVTCGWFELLSREYKYWVHAGTLSFSPSLSLSLSLSLGVPPHPFSLSLSLAPSLPPRPLSLLFF